jgi:DNA transposition AAA+ family ATPase
MKDELRKEIVDAAKLYIAEKGISLNEHGRRSEINPAYLSQMMNLKGDIADKWYYALAKSVGHNIDVIYWEHVNTAQYKAVAGHLEEARQLGRNRILIGETGSGKSYTLKRYVLTNPMDTYMVKVGQAHSIHTLIEDIMDCIGLEPCGTPVTRLKSIAHKLSMFQLEGRKPLLCIDEAENLKASAMGVLKNLYDYLEGVCPIVLFGTEQITDKITRMVKSNKVGIPQFYSRFKAGIRNLPPIDRTFNLFLETKVEDPRLKAYLRRICNNYRELHDYLELALREADRLGVDLTYGFFLDLHGIKERN